MYDEEVKKHPSYGMIKIGRTQGKCSDLFGSSIEHNSSVRLSIHNAEYIRHLNHDWYHPQSLPLIEIEMSAIQWAEAITNMNSNGTPVTLRYYNKEIIKGQEIDNKRVQIDNEFELKMKKLNENTNSLLRQATSLLNNKNMKVADKKELLDVIGMLQQELDSNIPFMKRQFSEQMDKTVSEAKCEVESFVAHKIHRLGLESLEQLKIGVKEE